MDNIYLHHDDQQIGPFNEAKVFVDCAWFRNKEQIV
jgi:hypothetical protein